MAKITFQKKQNHILVIYFKLRIFTSTLIIFILKKFTIATLSSMWESQIWIIGSQKICDKYSTLYFFPTIQNFHILRAEYRDKGLSAHLCSRLNLVQRSISWLGPGWVVLGIFSLGCISDFLNEVFLEIDYFVMCVHLLDPKGICN